MHDDKRDRFVDDLLEASLKQYRGDEPRPGLEMRILAGVRTRERAARRRWLDWAVPVCAGILAAIILALHFAHVPHQQPAPRASLTQPTAKPPAMASQQQPGLRPSSSADPRLWGPRLALGPNKKPQAPKPEARATRPTRPEQFPTPFPLTEQEKLLLAYFNKATKPDLIAGTNETDEVPMGDLEIPQIEIAPLEIKPLDDSQSEQGK